MRRLEKPIAVVGSGHSGTFYISEVFQRCGIDVRHERMGADGIASWGYTHFKREQFPDFGLTTDALVFQQTRQPLNVISSLQAMDNKGWTEIGRRAGYRGIQWNPHDDPHPLRGMRYWLYWNTFAESLNPVLRYRVEDLPTVWPQILELLHLPMQPLPHVNKGINKHQYNHIFTWPELKAANEALYEAISKMSYRYGY